MLSTASGQTGKKKCQDHHHSNSTLISRVHIPGWLTLQKSFPPQRVSVFRFGGLPLFATSHGRSAEGAGSEGLTVKRRRTLPLVSADAEGVLHGSAVKADGADGASHEAAASRTVGVRRRSKAVQRTPAVVQLDNRAVSRPDVSAAVAVPGGSERASGASRGRGEASSYSSAGAAAGGADQLAGSGSSRSVSASDSTPRSSQPGPRDLGGGPAAMLPSLLEVPPLPYSAWGSLSSENPLEDHQRQHQHPMGPPPPPLPLMPPAGSVMSDWGLAGTQPQMNAVYRLIRKKELQHHYHYRYQHQRQLRGQGCQPSRQPTPTPTTATTIVAAATAATAPMRSKAPADNRGDPFGAGGARNTAAAGPSSEAGDDHVAAPGAAVDVHGARPPGGRRVSAATAATEASKLDPSPTPRTHRRHTAATGSLPGQRQQDQSGGRQDEVQGERCRKHREFDTVEKLQDVGFPPTGHAAVDRVIRIQQIHLRRRQRQRQEQQHRPVGSDGFSGRAAIGISKEGGQQDTVATPRLEPAPIQRMRGSGSGARATPPIVRDAYPSGPLRVVADEVANGGGSSSCGSGSIQVSLAPSASTEPCIPGDAYDEGAAASAGRSGTSSGGSAGSGSSSSLLREAVMSELALMNPVYRMIRKHELLQRRRHQARNASSGASASFGAIDPWAADDFADVMLGGLMLGPQPPLLSLGTPARDANQQAMDGPTSAVGTRVGQEAAKAAGGQGSDCDGPQQLAAREQMDAGAVDAAGGLDELTDRNRGMRLGLNPVLRLIRKKQLQQRLRLRGRLAADEGGALAAAAAARKPETPPADKLRAEAVDDLITDGDSARQYGGISGASSSRWEIGPADAVGGRAVMNPVYRLIRKKLLQSRRSARAAEATAAAVTTTPAAGAEAGGGEMAIADPPQRGPPRRPAASLRATAAVWKPASAPFFDLDAYPSPAKRADRLDPAWLRRQEVDGAFRSGVASTAGMNPPADELLIELPLSTNSAATDATDAGSKEARCGGNNEWSDSVAGLRGAASAQAATDASQQVSPAAPPARLVSDGLAETLVGERSRMNPVYRLIRKKELQLRRLTALTPSLPPQPPPQQQLGWPLDARAALPTWLQGWSEEGNTTPMWLMVDAGPTPAPAAGVGRLFERDPPALLNPFDVEDKRADAGPRAPHQGRAQSGAAWMERGALAGYERIFRGSTYDEDGDGAAEAEADGAGTYGPVGVGLEGWNGQDEPQVTQYCVDTSSHAPVSTQTSPQRQVSGVPPFIGVQPEGEKQDAPKDRATAPGRGHRQRRSNANEQEQGNGKARRQHWMMPGGGGALRGQREGETAEVVPEATKASSGRSAAVAGTAEPGPQTLRLHVQAATTSTARDGSDAGHFARSLISPAVTASTARQQRIKELKARLRAKLLASTRAASVPSEGTAAATLGASQGASAEGRRGLPTPSPNGQALHEDPSLAATPGTTADTEGATNGIVDASCDTASPAGSGNTSWQARQQQSDPYRTAVLTARPLPWQLERRASAAAGGSSTTPLAGRAEPSGLLRFLQDTNGSDDGLQGRLRRGDSLEGVGDVTRPRAWGGDCGVTPQQLLPRFSGIGQLWQSVGLQVGFGRPPPPEQPLEVQLKDLGVSARVASRLASSDIVSMRGWKPAEVLQRLRVLQGVLGLADGVAPTPAGATSARTPTRAAGGAKAEGRGRGGDSGVPEHNDGAGFVYAAGAAAKQPNLLTRRPEALEANFTSLAAALKLDKCAARSLVLSWPSLLELQPTSLQRRLMALARELGLAGALLGKADADPDAVRVLVTAVSGDGNCATACGQGADLRLSLGVGQEGCSENAGADLQSAANESGAGSNLLQAALMFDRPARVQVAGLQGVSCRDAVTDVTDVTARQFVAMHAAEAAVTAAADIVRRYPPALALTAKAVASRVDALAAAINAGPSHSLRPLGIHFGESDKLPHCNTGSSWPSTGVRDRGHSAIANSGIIEAGVAGRHGPDIGALSQAAGRARAVALILAHPGLLGYSPRALAERWVALDAAVAAAEELALLTGPSRSQGVSLQRLSWRQQLSCGPPAAVARCLAASESRLQRLAFLAMAANTHTADAPGTEATARPTSSSGALKADAASAEGVALNTQGGSAATTSPDAGRGLVQHKKPGRPQGSNFEGRAAERASAPLFGAAEHVFGCDLSTDRRPFVQVPAADKLARLDGGNENGASAHGAIVVRRAAVAAYHCLSLSTVIVMSAERFLSRFPAFEDWCQRRLGCGRAST